MIIDAVWCSETTFHHQVPTRNQGKVEAFKHINALLGTMPTDAIAIARFMQTMSPYLCHAYVGKMINIHRNAHPSFLGTCPYHRAAARGVKLIGAKCHYATEELDEGPLIEQDIIWFTHCDAAADLIRKGRDCDVIVCATALCEHLKNRIISHGHRTIVFE